MLLMPETTATISVWVTPGASAEGIAGLREDAVHLRVSAPAKDGRANAAVQELLAHSLNLPKRRVQIVRGHMSRRKLVVVEGLSSEEVLRQLGLESPQQ